MKPKMTTRPPRSKLTLPTVHLYAGRPYKPSWAHVPAAVVVPYLAGHRGLVGKHRDQITRNTPQSDT